MDPYVFKRNGTCGGQACYFDTQQVRAFKPDILAYMSKRIGVDGEIVTANKASHVDAKVMQNVVAEFLRGVVNADLGLRIDSVSTVSPTNERQLHRLQNIFGENFEKYTTYRSVSVRGTSVYGLILSIAVVLPNMSHIIGGRTRFTVQLPCQSYASAFGKSLYSREAASFLLGTFQGAKTILDALHAKNDYHGDFKTENMVYCPLDGSVRVIDYPQSHQAEPTTLDMYSILFDTSLPTICLPSGVQTFTFRMTMPGRVTGSLFDQLCFNTTLSICTTGMMRMKIINKKTAFELYGELHYEAATTFMVTHGMYVYLNPIMERLSASMRGLDQNEVREIVKTMDWWMKFSDIMHKPFIDFIYEFAGDHSKSVKTLYDKNIVKDFRLKNERTSTETHLGILNRNVYALMHESLLRKLNILATILDMTFSIQQQISDLSANITGGGKMMRSAAKAVYGLISPTFRRNRSLWRVARNIEEHVPKTSEKRKKTERMAVILSYIDHIVMEHAEYLSNLLQEAYIAARNVHGANKKAKHASENIMMLHQHIFPREANAVLLVAYVERHVSVYKTSRLLEDVLKRLSRYKSDVLHAILRELYEHYNVLQHG